MSIAARKKKTARTQKRARQRRTPEEARSTALACARKLLLAEGPQAVTLQAVASEIGMSHTNLIHHFGSADGLQSELMKEMVESLTRTIESAVMRLRVGEGDIKEFVDLVFDAFDQGGAGRLATWIIMSGNAERLEPVGEVVRKTLATIERGSPHPSPHQSLIAATTLVTIAALGDAIFGKNLSAMLGASRSDMRSLTAKLLPTVLANDREECNQKKR